MSIDIRVACNEPLPENSSVMCCAVCEFTDHWETCSGVAEVSFKKRGAEAKKTWKCPTCRKGEPNSEKHELRPSNGPGDECTLAEISKKLSAIMTLHAKVDSFVEMKTTICAIERSVQLMSDNYDELLSQIQQQGKEKNI